MQIEHVLEERIAVSAIALLAAAVYGLAGARTSSCSAQSAPARYTVAAVALALLPLCWIGPVPPVASYGVLCMALASVYVVDTLKQERARRRRVASLEPRPPADALPIVWIATAAASAFMLAPYVVLGEEPVAASFVALCALATAAFAWRVATAPEQLAGNDVRAERKADRALRGMRAGVASVLAIGSIMVFMSFENSSLPSVLPLQRTLLSVAQTIWVSFGISIVLWWRWCTRGLHGSGASFPVDP